MSMTMEEAQLQGGAPYRSASVISLGRRQHANAGPLGLCAFALTTFVSSFYNMGAGVPSGGAGSLILGLAIFYGGIVQILAGMWELSVGKTFEGTTFSSYGAFWCSYSTFLIPAFGVFESYGNDVRSLNNALGIFVLAWAIMTAILWFATVRSNIVLCSIFPILFTSQLTQSISYFAQMETGNWLYRLSGGLSLITAFLAWYFAAFQLYTPTTAWFTLPIGPLNVHRTRVAPIPVEAYDQ